jgi:hypothetical protein
VPVRRLDDAGLAAVADLAVLARYRAKVATVLGSECLWWTGAVAGRSERERTDGGGHGRFWYAPSRVIVAFAVMRGVDALAEARLLGHRCHNPLCQRIAPERGGVERGAESARVGGPAVADLQQLVGARGREVDKQLLFFTRSGFSAKAVDYADSMDVALFLNTTATGAVEPLGAAAHALVAQPRTGRGPPTPRVHPPRRDPPEAGRPGRRPGCGR